MKLRGKLLLVAILPLVAALGLIALVLRQQQSDLATRQRELVRHSYYESTQAELRHYVALALSTVSPYYNTGRDDEQMKRLARYQLADLDYGPDGYFFLYDFNGTNLMHSRQPELEGKNLMEFRDANGRQVIHDMIDKARAGGGFIEYSWNKPSAGKEVAKLAYVTALDRWHWMIGTGIYTDDLDKITAEIDRQLESNLDATMRWMALTALAAVAIVMASILILSISELRAADAKLTLLARQLVRSQEDERAWLSRELHDSTSQMLVSAKLLTESALERLAPTEDKVRPMLQRALARISDAVDDVRSISHRLRPAELDTLGLTAALRELGDEMCTPAGIAFEWQEGHARRTV